MSPKDQTISVTEASRMGVSRLVSDAATGHTRIVMCRNEPTAVVTSMDEYDRYMRLEEMEQDIRLFALAVVRMATDSGARHDLDDVAREFGVDLSDEG